MFRNNADLSAYIGTLKANAHKAGEKARQAAAEFLQREMGKGGEKPKGVKSLSDVKADKRDKENPGLIFIAPLISVTPYIDSEPLSPEDEEPETGGSDAASVPDDLARKAEGVFNRVYEAEMQRLMGE